MRDQGWLMAAVIAFVAVSGCKTPEREYCALNFGTPGFQDAALCCETYPEFCPAGGVCKTSDDCSLETPVCSPAQNCVECLQQADCTDGARPICDDAIHACIGCRGSQDCPATDLCLAEGACAAAEEVAYVSENGTANGTCSKEQPCQTLTQVLALTPARKYIKVTGTIDASTAIAAGTVTIYGVPGMATLTKSGNGAVLDITKAANVTLIDLNLIGSADHEALTLSMGPGPTVSMTGVDVRSPSADGIVVTEGKLTMTESVVHNSLKAGVSVGGKGTLVVDGKSRISDNGQDGVKAVMGSIVELRHSSILSNKGTAGVFSTNAAMVTIESSVIALNSGSNGGASIAGALVIRNSIFAGNGNSTVLVGGLTLNSTNAVFEFNTVADNTAMSPAKIGMSCVAPINVSSSILTGNAVNGCNVTYSLTDTALTGTGNKVGLPKFKDVAAPLGATFYRIDQGSDAIDGAGPSSLAEDIDGDPRPATGKDMGADEYK